MKTVPDFRACSVRRARGSVAVELAIILPPLAFILFGIFFFGLIFWQYNAMKHATEAAARYMAMGTWEEIRGGDERRTAAETMMETAALGVGIKLGVSPSVFCFPVNNCKSLTTKPTTVTAQASIVFEDLSGLWIVGPFSVDVSSTVPYTN